LVDLWDKAKMFHLMKAMFCTKVPHNTCRICNHNLRKFLCKKKIIQRANTNLKLRLRRKEIWRIWEIKMCIIKVKLRLAASFWETLRILNWICRKTTCLISHSSRLRKGLLRMKIFLKIMIWTKEIVWMIIFWLMIIIRKIWEKYRNLFC
jgi:hypothetical protein